MAVLGKFECAGVEKGLGWTGFCNQLLGFG